MHNDHEDDSSPLCNLFMVYTEDELDEIERLYSEAKLMIDTMQILTQ